VKSLIQAVVVIVIAALLGVSLTWNPIKLLGVGAIVILGSAFFSCLSMTIAGIVLSRDRLMGIGQAITMPLFFGSNALYPVDVMPGRLADLVRDVMCGTPSASRCGLRRRIVPAHGLISDQRGRSPWPQRIPLI